MSKAGAIEILNRLRGGCAAGWMFDRLTDAIEELEEEEKDKSPALGIAQEYRPKCDWCGEYLGVTAINHKESSFCSVKCHVASDDHLRIADLMEWRNRISNAFK